MYRFDTESVCVLFLSNRIQATRLDRSGVIVFLPFRSGAGQARLASDDRLSDPTATDTKVLYQRPFQVHGIRPERLTPNS